MSSASKFINKIVNNNLNQFHNYLSQKFIVLKKSFTLVELSIVLLVLALLVSTLLVGRQIIDRAKVQQVISEIDYYTKNFQMFRDQYDFLPGALGVENCKKYPEFSMQKGDEPTQYPSQCDDPRSQTVMISSNNYYTSYKQANFSMVDMVVSGMVENRSSGERRRKAFDIATETKQVTVEIPVVRGGYATLRKEFLMKYVDFESSAGPIGGTDCYYRTAKIAQDTYSMNNENYSVIGGRRGSTGNYMEKTYESFWNNLPNCPTSGIGGSSCGGASCDCLCHKINGETYHINYRSAFLYTPDVTMVKLTSDGYSFLNGKYESITGTVTKEGELRIGLLLNKEEIENQANKSSFDNKTWISYSGGKVDNLMIYGIGNNNLFASAGENNVIVFFHFDPDKTEVTDDGAVSFNLFDLMNKKLGSLSSANQDNGSKTSSGNTLIPINKTSGEGFNFGYIMR